MLWNVISILICISVKRQKSWNQSEASAGTGWLECKSSKTGSMCKLSIWADLTCDSRPVDQWSMLTGLILSHRCIVSFMRGKKPPKYRNFSYQRCSTRYSYWRLWYLLPCTSTCHWKWNVMKMTAWCLGNVTEISLRNCSCLLCGLWAFQLLIRQSSKYSAKVAWFWGHKELTCLTKCI